MTRHYVTRRPCSAAELLEEGPAIRVRDLCHITGICSKTILADIREGRLKARKRSDDYEKSPWLIARPEARRYAERMGSLHDAA